MEKLDLENGLLWFVAFLFSTTFHEAAHAFVAWRGGDPTAYHGGQVTLSPIPHIRREPIGMLLVPLVTSLTQGWAIGWASTPYDPGWEARYPRRAALMAAAGPAANLVIAILAFVAIKVCLAAGVFHAPISITIGHVVEASSPGLVLAYAGRILSILLMLNVLLFVFNLLPFPPLDGGSAIGLFLPESAMIGLRNFSRTGGSMIGFIVAYLVFPYIARPLIRLVVALLYPGASYQ